jgi:Domain of unknown function (DUF5666)
MNMAIPAALRFKRSLQVVGLLGTSLAAVLISVRTPAGIQGSGLRSLAVIGTVTAVGDGITVGDITYPTSGATFTIDGESGNKAQLRNGYVVSLLGAASPGGDKSSVSEVIFNGNVQGPVSGLDAQSGSFFVLQQAVHVDSQTTFGAGIAPTGLAGLQNGVVVEVSGFANSAGELVASHIEAKGTGSIAQIVGHLQALDAGRQTFRINSLPIDYHSAEVEGFLAEGAAVAVRGANIGADGTLVASSVEVLPAMNGPPDAVGRIEGLITSFPSSSYFEVDGQPVAVDSRTKLHLHGPLGLDVAVEVTGTFDVNGVLVASKVKSSK